jgi:hypothetical protein
MALGSLVAWCGPAAAGEASELKLLAVAAPEARPDPYLYYVDEIRLSVTVEKPVAKRFELTEDQLLSALKKRVGSIALDHRIEREVGAEDGSVFFNCDPSLPEYRVLHIHFSVGLSPSDADKLSLTATSRKRCDLRRSEPYGSEMEIETKCGSSPCVCGEIADRATRFLTRIIVPPPIRPYD